VRIYIRVFPAVWGRFLEQTVWGGIPFIYSSWAAWDCNWSKDSGGSCNKS